MYIVLFTTVDPHLANTTTPYAYLNIYVPGGLGGTESPQ
jgi:hypothetical protein